MRNYSKAINLYLASQSPNYALTELRTLLEHLWHSYSTHNPIDSGVIRQAFASMEPIFDSLSFQASNALLENIAALCTEYEKVSFLEGLHVGIRLASELSKWEQPDS